MRIEACGSAGGKRQRTYQWEPKLFSIPTSILPLHICSSAFLSLLSLGNRYDGNYDQ